MFNYVLLFLDTELTHLIEVLSLRNEKGQYIQILNGISPAETRMLKPLLLKPW